MEAIFFDIIFLFIFTFYKKIIIAFCGIIKCCIVKDAVAAEEEQEREEKKTQQEKIRF